MPSRTRIPIQINVITIMVLTRNFILSIDAISCYCIWHAALAFYSVGSYTSLHVIKCMTPWTCLITTQHTIYTTLFPIHSVTIKRFDLRIILADKGMSEWPCFCKIFNKSSTALCVIWNSLIQAAKSSHTKFPCM